MYEISLMVVGNWRAEMKGEAKGKAEGKAEGIDHVNKRKNRDSQSHFNSGHIISDDCTIHWVDYRPD